MVEHVGQTVAHYLAEPDERQRRTPERTLVLKRARSHAPALGQLSSGEQLILHCRDSSEGRTAGRVALLRCPDKPGACGTSCLSVWGSVDRH